MAIIAEYILRENFNDTFLNNNGINTGSTSSEDTKFGELYSIYTLQLGKLNIKDIYENQGKPNQMSISTWISKYDDKLIIFYSGTNKLYIDLTSEKIVYNTTEVGSITGIPNKNSNWYHVVLTYNNGKSEVYIDGWNQNYQKSENNKVYFGIYGNESASNYLNIKADGSENSNLYTKYQIYDHALSRNEVLDIYTEPLLNYTFDTPQEIIPIKDNVWTKSFSYRIPTVCPSDDGWMLVTSDIITLKPNTLYSYRMILQDGNILLGDYQRKCLLYSVDNNGEIGSLLDSSIITEDDTGSISTPESYRTSDNKFYIEFYINKDILIYQYMNRKINNLILMEGTNIPYRSIEPLDQTVFTINNYAPNYVLAAISKSENRIYQGCPIYEVYYSYINKCVLDNLTSPDRALADFTFSLYRDESNSFRPELRLSLFNPKHNYVKFYNMRDTEGIVSSEPLILNYKDQVNPVLLFGNYNNFFDKKIYIEMCNKNNNGDIEVVSVGRLQLDDFYIKMINQSTNNLSGYILTESMIEGLTTTIRISPTIENAAYFNIFSGNNEISGLKNIETPYKIQPYSLMSESCNIKLYDINEKLICTCNLSFFGRGIISKDILTIGAKLDTGSSKYAAGFLCSPSSDRIEFTLGENNKIGTKMLPKRFHSYNSTGENETNWWLIGKAETDDINTFIKEKEIMFGFYYKEGILNKYYSFDLVCPLLIENYDQVPLLVNYDNAKDYIFLSDTSSFFHPTYFGSIDPTKTGKNIFSTVYNHTAKWIENDVDSCGRGGYRLINNGTNLDGILIGYGLSSQQMWSHLFNDKEWSMLFWIKLKKENSGSINQVRLLTLYDKNFEFQWYLSIDATNGLIINLKRDDTLIKSVKASSCLMYEDEMTSGKYNTISIANNPILYLDLDGYNVIEVVNIDNIISVYIQNNKGTFILSYDSSNLRIKNNTEDFIPKCGVFVHQGDFIISDIRILPKSPSYNDSLNYINVQYLRRLFKHKMEIDKDEGNIRVNSVQESAIGTQLYPSGHLVADNFGETDNNIVSMEENNTVYTHRLKEN